MGELTLSDVTKIYGDGDEQVVALDHVSLRAMSGELTAVVGPSGSGKTTLLAIAGALLQPTSGSVTLNGRALTGLSQSTMARVRLARIGFVLQSSNLTSSLTARDQLLLVADLAGRRRDPETARRADRLLAELGLERRAKHFPEQLSGGERQRVAIARALMNDPDVILADEPTASLDFARGHAVVTLLSREVRARDKVGVLVTHDERMLDLCDRIYRIADGRLVGDARGTQARAAVAMPAGPTP